MEALDKVFTFLGVGLLSALSDVVGRKPLLAYSALGFACTCLLQATATKSLSVLYLADLVDGLSSCMNSVCQAYVTDASLPERRAVNIGIFQGLSVAGACHGFLDGLGKILAVLCHHRDQLPDLHFREVVVKVRQ